MRMYLYIICMSHEIMTSKKHWNIDAQVDTAAFFGARSKKILCGH